MGTRVLGCAAQHVLNLVPFRARGGGWQAALLILLIVGSAWSVDEYYVYDRQTNSYVVRLYPMRGGLRADVWPRLIMAASVIILASMCRWRSSR